MPANAKTEQEFFEEAKIVAGLSRLAAKAVIGEKLKC
jgi:hypothetical protein